MQPGTSLVVPAPDRLSRSLQDLITVVADLRRRRVGFTTQRHSIAKLLGVSPGTLDNHIPDLREPRRSGADRRIEGGRP